MIYENGELCERMSRLSDSELLKIVKFDYKDFTEDALKVAREELSKRNIDIECLEDKLKEIGKVYNIEYAGFWRRVLAYFIDKLIINISVIILISMMDIFTGVLRLIVGFERIKGDVIETFLGIIACIIILVLGWLYCALFESSSKQATIGKMALGIKVTDLNGNRISFGRASSRFWAKIISNLTFSIGYAMVGFTQRKQALHDILTDCLVVNK